jgi:hypothetical protein
MNNSINSKKNAARTERLQKKLDSGIMAAEFPNVASIVISMIYSQKGMKESLPRVVNFFPASHAFFRVNCLNKDCVDGGFDFTHVIEGMVGHRKKAVKGQLSCGGDGSCDDNHSTIVYEVVIRYS